jgi:hypothetical protein
MLVPKIGAPEIEKFVKLDVSSIFVTVTVIVCVVALVEPSTARRVTR